MEQLFVFFTGASGYILIELMWRGYSHWTMFLTGGICFLALYNVFNALKDLSTPLKALLGSLIITVIEFIVGVTVNIILGLKVWDYSNVPFNILGQVCLPYSFLWFAVSVPLIYFSNYLKSRLTKKTSQQKKIHEN